MAARRFMAATFGVSLLAACDPLPQPLYSETTPPPAYRVQPGGVRIDNEGFQMDPEGYRIDKSGARVGIIDVGFRTADYTISDKTRYSERGSASTDSGISLAYTAIANYLQEKSGVSVELYRLYEGVSKGTIKIKGKRYDLTAVVQAVDVPVTLKIRTGWAADQKNALAIARIAEDSGIAALAVHGRTRDQQYTGVAEYDTIAAVKAALRIPVLANGDIDSPEKAAFVLRHTGADAVMIGRAAQGRPWIFREIAHFLATGEHQPPPDLAEVRPWLLDHLHDHYDLYGEFTGVRSARKHLGWYVRSLPLSATETDAFRQLINSTTTIDEQLQAVTRSFDAWQAGDSILPWKLAA
mgnify:CR=1 FL=1